MYITYIAIVQWGITSRRARRSRAMRAESYARCAERYRQVSARDNIQNSMVKTLFDL
jgi:hypothetical protein